MGRFDGKAVIITGAASGIGAATAARFAAEGASLALADLDGRALEQGAGGLGLDEAQLLTREIDVAEAAAVEALVAAAVERFGGIDVLVSNAGMGSFGYVTELTPEQWHRVLAVDLDSVFYAARAAMPHLVERRGCIVNTASISGIRGDYGFAAYNAAKAGVINLTRTLALDHGKDGVRVNALCPGLIATPLSAPLTGHDATREEYRRRVPLGRAGTPEDMAGAIVFLASDDAAYVTGTCLVADGGLTAATGQPDFNRLLRAP